MGFIVSPIGEAQAETAPGEKDALPVAGPLNIKAMYRKFSRRHAKIMAELSK